jgi:pyruvate/2-oxoglutarate dehydrogenase complex dihydrolipoamide acyltransferase (E2) component
MNKYQSFILSNTTCFVSNLGSIRLCADYHHLANRGTNSIFLIIGQKKENIYIDRDGNVAKKDVLPLAVTIDERIADGVYFSKSLSRLRKYLLHPEVLDESLVAKKSAEDGTDKAFSQEKDIEKVC